MNNMTKTQYQIIDSSQRSIIDEYQLGYPVTLAYDAMNFVSGSNTVTITMDPPLKLGEKFRLENVTTPNIHLKSALNFKKGSHYLRIRHISHGLSLPETVDFEICPYVEYLPKTYYAPNQNIPDADNYYIANINKYLHLVVEISDYKLGKNISRIGNVYLNWINQKHEIYLLYHYQRGYYHLDPDSYLIMLPTEADVNYHDGSGLFAPQLQVKFDFIHGIPLDIFNTTTFTVIATQPQTIKFETFITALTNGSSVSKGMILYPVITMYQGYPDVANFQLNLGTEYQQVTAVRLVSSIFTNMQRIINQNNHTLCWRNLTDAETEYCLNLEPGNYSPSQLATAIQQAAAQVPRRTIYPITPISDYDSYIDTTKYDASGHYRYHLMEMTVDTNTDLVAISLWQEVLLLANNTNLPLKLPPEYIQITLNTPLNTDIATLFYLTPRSNHPIADLVVNQQLEHVYGMLYYRAAGAAARLKLNLNLAVLVNYFSYADSYDQIHSINTTTRLDNNYLFDGMATLTICHHNLPLKSLIITDKFDNGQGENFMHITLYEIVAIIDQDTVMIERLAPGQKYHVLYDDLIINFFPENPADAITNADWLKKYTLTDIRPGAMTQWMIVSQYQHGLKVNDEIRISNSLPVRGVSAGIINTSHKIARIMGPDHYAVRIMALSHDSDVWVDPEPNLVSVIYPDVFQILAKGNMNYFLTFGTKEDSPLAHEINNRNYPSNIPHRFSTTGFHYFFVCCPELGPGLANHFSIPNILAVIKWYDNPGSQAVIFDSFVNTASKFDPPIPKIHKLTFQLRNPDGTFVDLYNSNYTLILEITSDKYSTLDL